MVSLSCDEMGVPSTLSSKSETRSTGLGLLLDVSAAIGLELESSVRNDVKPAMVGLSRKTESS